MLGVLIRPRDIHSIGKRTREWIVDVQTCPLLGTHRISMVGISEALPGFNFVRTSPEMSVLMASTKGGGSAYLDGEYTDFAAGMAYLMPARVLHAYAATGRDVWRVCWVCYIDPAAQLSIISGDRPALVRAHGEPLDEAICGLYRETLHDAQPSVQRLYVELIHEYSLRVARDLRADSRLIELWRMVEGDLARHWTLDELACRAGMSDELLRVLCEKSTGRSPMKQVTYLRMQRAAIALASTQDKIAAIADEVGYSDPYAFSVAFKRNMGMSPKSFRVRKREASIH
jgi:AraC-like DNA-binding protein